MTLNVIGSNDPVLNNVNVIVIFFSLYLVRCLKCKNNSNTFDPLMDIMLDIKVNKWILISSDLASGSLLIFAWSSKIKILEYSSVKVDQHCHPVKFAA